MTSDVNLPTEPDLVQARAARKRRLQFRASHRGTREADIMIGGFVDREIDALSDADIAWFELLLEELDVDIMAWITATRAPPPIYATPMMQAMQRLDYLNIQN